MRLLALLRGDVRFQWKYGFYFIYLVFTLLYALLLFAVPQTVRRTVATILIFTDPAAMGLFFMGALVLLEKSQRVNCALAVSPVEIGEYILAKMMSLAFVGLLVGMLLAAMGGVADYVSCALGVLFASFLFSMCGLIVAMRVATLNQFLIFTIPFELFICLPPAMLLFGVEPALLILHPGVAAVKLIHGGATAPLLCVCVLLGWCIGAFLLCKSAVRRNFLSMGGVSL
ncbi:MAG: ABC transporter permease [Clostridia bacterium]|nr:ABC transporter permease [Clostridia bacterium]